MIKKPDEEDLKQNELDINNDPDDSEAPDISLEPYKKQPIQSGEVIQLEKGDTKISLGSTCINAEGLAIICMNIYKELNKHNGRPDKRRGYVA